MDVIRILLNTAMTITLALMKLAVSIFVWAVKKIAGRVRTKAQPSPAPQERPKSVRPTAVPNPVQPAQAAAAGAPPEVHVHVHFTEDPRASGTAPQPSAMNMRSRLAVPDDGIYITTGSHLIVEHPASADLLDGLDYILYMAAHRNGRPFHLTPLDQSGPSLSTTPDALPAVETDFVSDERYILPIPDGEVWVRREGRAAFRAQM